MLPRELISGPGLRLVVFGFLLSLFSSFGQTFFIALFGAEIRAEYGLSNGGFGAVYSLANLASGLTMIWLGAVLDRMSLLRYAAGATLALGAACVLMALAQSTVLLALALFGLRLSGQGMLSHAAVTGMARAFQQSRGKAIAIAALGHPAGEALLPIAAVGAAVLLGWRGVWLGAAALLLAALLSLVALLARHGDWRQAAPATGAEAAAPSFTRADLLRDGRFHLLCPALVGPPFIVTGLFFHQVPLVEAKGWQLAMFASSFAAYALASTAGAVLCGALVDRAGAVRLMPFYLLPLALGCMVLALGEQPLLAFAFMSLAGLGAGATAAIVAAMWAESMAPAISARSGRSRPRSG